MADERQPRRYCVLFQLGKSTSMSRLAEVVPGLTRLVDDWSKGEKEMACRSNDGQLFGYFFVSKKPVAMMTAEFEMSGSSDNSDSVVIFEVGEKFSGTSGAFVRAWTWLQHHGTK